MRSTRQTTRMHITTHIPTHMTRVLLLILLLILMLQVWENDDYALNEANDAIALKELKQVSLIFFLYQLCLHVHMTRHMYVLIYILNTKIHIL